MHTYICKQFDSAKQIHGGSRHFISDMQLEGHPLAPPDVDVSEREVNRYAEYDFCHHVKQMEF